MAIYSLRWPPDHLQFSSFNLMFRAQSDPVYAIWLSVAWPAPGSLRVRNRLIFSVNHLINHLHKRALTLRYDRQNHVKRHPGEGGVLLFARSMQSKARNTPTLFTALLRVKGIVAVNGPMMWMHHLAQAARECGVPAVQISPLDQVVDPLQRLAVSYITAKRSGNCSFPGFHRSSANSH